MCSFPTGLVRFPLRSGYFKPPVVWKYISPSPHGSRYLGVNILTCCGFKDLLQRREFDFRCGADTSSRLLFGIPGCVPPFRRGSCNLGVNIYVLWVQGSVPIGCVRLNYLSYGADSSKLVLEKTLVAWLRATRHAWIPKNLTMNTDENQLQQREFLFRCGADTQKS